MILYLQNGFELGLCRSMIPLII